MEGNFLLPMLVFLPIIGAPVIYMVGQKNEKARSYLANGFVFIEFAIAIYLLVMYCISANIVKASPIGLEIQTGYVVYYNIPNFCGLGLYFVLDGFRVLYLTIASFMWLMATVLSKEYFRHYNNKNRYYLFLLITLGATMGVFLSADLYTTFIFFEIMSFASYAWVAQDEKKESLRAADTYLAVAVIGGLVMLMGLFLLYSELGTLQIGGLYTQAREYMSEGGTEEGRRILYGAGICLLVGFGAKAGAFPLHIWLPKAHPVAPAPASALLSGILTKTGIFGILIISSNLFLYDLKWGTLILIIGVLTMVVGAVLALFSINLKRTLACSSVSQIGFILVGIGMQGLLGIDNSLAVRGSLLHMVNHSLLKLLLFSVAGVIFMNIHKLDLNEIRGFGKKKPVLQFVLLMGAMGIGGIPFWSGYTSKTLIHESIVEYILELQMGNVTAGILNVNYMKAIEWIFLICGGLTVAYMMKLFVAICIEKNNNATLQGEFEAKKKIYVGRINAGFLLFVAMFFPIAGAFPEKIMDKIADLGEGFMHPEHMAARIHYFSVKNLEGSILSIFLGLLIYFIIVRKWMMTKNNEGTIYLDRWNKNLDLENGIYRPAFQLLSFLLGVVCRLLDSILDGIVVLLRKTVYVDSKLPHELEEGTFYTHALGGILDCFVEILNKTIWKKSPRKKCFGHKLALKHEELSEDNTIIGRSLSFGLLLFCAGLMLTLVYLLK